MEITCPACGKINDGEQAAACQRCRCDLSRLRIILQAALWHMRAAAVFVRAGELSPACHHAERSWMLKHSEESAHIGLAVTAAQGDMPAHRAWRSRLRSCRDS